MTIQVQCYAGRKADERPVSFRIDDHHYLVDDIIEQWYGPDQSFFRVRRGAHVVLLCHMTSADTWRIEGRPPDRSM